jgi:hypothetical protein
MLDIPKLDDYRQPGEMKIYSKADIDSAVAAGVLSSESARRLHEHVAGLRREHASDREAFRLVGGFNDIFVAIACCLFLISFGTLLSSYRGVAFMLVGVSAWILAEYFTRKKHLALTSLVLLAAVAAGVFFSCADLTGDMRVAGGATAVLSLAHWKRFQVPAAVACGVAATVGLGLACVLVAFPEVKKYLSSVFFCAGLAVLAQAMRWDCSDTARRTYRSEVAFWLHLLAAPMLVHPVFLFFRVFDGNTNLKQTLVMTAMYMLIGFISLLIDRRALMISSLIYVLYAFATIFREYSITANGLALAALFVSASLLLLAAFWQPARVWALGLMPHALGRRLPPVG